MSDEDPNTESVDESVDESVNESVNESSDSPQTLQEMLPEDLRNDPSLKDVQDVGTLAKMFRDTKAMQGNSLRIPGEDASEEDWQQFYSKVAERAPGIMPKPDFDSEEQRVEFYKSLGMPEQPSEYEIPEMEGIQMDDDRVEFLQSAAHDIGLTKKQFHDVMAKVLEKDAADIQSQQQARDQKMAELKQEWGQAFDKYAGYAEQLRQQYLPFIPAEQMGAETLRGLAQLAEAMGGEGAEVLNQSSASDSVTPEEAQNQINEIYNNRQHPFWNASDPGHSDALQRMLKLQKAANPGASTTVSALRASGG
jgi:uncharacterized protein YukE